MAYSSTQQENYDVYQGTWTNWSRGRVLGATLTLNKRDAGFLISFIALFIAVIGTAFWRLACFGFHQWLSSNTPQDGFHHQRQIVLRNSSTGLNGLRVLCQMVWAWRHTAKRPFIRVLPLIIFSLVTVGGFAVAGVLSSNVATSSSSEVLVRSRICGTMSSALYNSNDFHMYYSPRQRQDQILADEYARRCYSNESTTQPCRPYVRKQLPMAISRNVSCPFGGNICKTNTTNMQIDSGYIDSNDDLGINAPESFLWRLVANCAPLVTEGYTKVQTKSGYGPNDTYVYFYYGDDLSLYRIETNQTEFYNRPYNGNNTGLLTYRYEKRPEKDNLIRRIATSSADYTLGVRFARFDGGFLDSAHATFLPNTELLNTDADIGLFFLSANDVLFTAQSDDLWYSAHNVTPDVGTREGGLYWTDEPAASVLACTSQYQICNGKRCTPLSASLDTLSRASGIWSSSDQKKLFDWFWNNVGLVGVQGAALNLGAGALRSRDNLAEGMQGPIPDNQWQVDVEHWFATALSLQQFGAVNAATGPADSHLWKWIDTNATQFQRDRCNGQKIISDSYTSFNVFGMCVIFVVGGIVIILSVATESLTSCIERLRGHGVSPSRLEWVTNDKFQLHRLAHEELGIGTWSDTDSSVPVTAPGEMLGTIDVSEPCHPRLRLPSPSKEEESLIQSKRQGDSEGGTIR